MIESAARGVLFVNGQFCGPLEEGGQAFPASPEAEIYVQLFPFSGKAAPLTVAMRLRGGEIERLEPQEHAYALLWPDGILELELRPEWPGETPAPQETQTAASGTLLRYLTMRLAGDAATWDAYARGEGAAAEIALGNGAALMVPRKTFLERAGTPLKPWTDAEAWALGGRNDAPAWSSGHIAYVNDDGNLVLTDDGGKQRNAALYTGHVFTKTSAFDLSFTWTPTQNRWAGKAAWAEGFAFFLTATNNAAGYAYANQVYGQPSDAYGFRCYIYRGNGNAVGFAWLVNNAEAGLCAAYTDYSELDGGLGGITLTRPIAFAVTMRNGVMDVTMRQEGKTWHAAYDFAQCFTGNGLTDANAPRLIGLSGGTGSWGDPNEGKTVPYAEQTFSDFAGFVWGEHEDKDPAAHAPSAETWRLSGDAWLTADPGFLFSTNKL